VYGQLYVVMCHVDHLCLLCGVMDFPSFCFILCYFCMGIFVRPTLYDLLLAVCGSVSSLFTRSVIYVIKLSIDGVSFLVRTYRRCILDIWSTWR
jgi:hypothetical protein